MKLLLICPKCRNKMQYENRTGEIIGKNKRCVYCGKSFTINRERIEGKVE
ncbi:MAG: hypothetical protein ACLFTH_04365 [Candidatus Woesearchaeota archaeon]